jgi:hypothetical protein
VVRDFAVVRASASSLFVRPPPVPPSARCRLPLAGCGSASSSRSNPSPRAPLPYRPFLSLTAAASTDPSPPSPPAVAPYARLATVSASLIVDSISPPPPPPHRAAPSDPPLISQHCCRISPSGGDRTRQYGGVGVGGPSQSSAGRQEHAHSSVRLPQRTHCHRHRSKASPVVVVDPRRQHLSSQGALRRCRAEAPSRRRRLLRGSDITALRCLDRNATSTGLLFDCAGWRVQAYGGLADNPLQLI